MTKRNFHPDHHTCCVQRLTFHVVRTIFLIMFSCALHPSVSAQITHADLITKPSTGLAASFYYLAKPAEFTILVNVWGFVQKPGMYEVPSSTNLVQLISYAGGPMQYAKLNRVRIIRIVMDEENAILTNKELKVNLKELWRLHQQDLRLFPGDTVVIDHTRWPTMRDVFSIVATTVAMAASVAFFVDRLTQ